MSAQQSLLSLQPLGQGELPPGGIPGDPYPGDDLPALRLVTVPDSGPPFDGEPLAGAAPAAVAWQSGRDQDCRYPGGTVTGDCLTGAGRATDAPADRDPCGEWPQQFARLLTETLAGARPVRQVLPWTSERARVHLRRLTPLFSCGQRPRVLRVIATRPTREVIEMTVIVVAGSRTHALAIRLEQGAPRRQSGPAGQLARDRTLAATPPRWICTDIEAA